MFNLFTLKDILVYYEYNVTKVLTTLLIYLYCWQNLIHICLNSPPMFKVFRNFILFSEIVQKNRKSSEYFKILQYKFWIPWLPINVTHLALHFFKLCYARYYCSLVKNKRSNLFKMCWGGLSHTQKHKCAEYTTKTSSLTKMNHVFIITVVTLFLAEWLPLV